MKITKIAHTVKKLLIDYPACKDNDNLLILKVWAEQEPLLREKTYSFRDFADKFMIGKYPSTESIRRSRQKLQEEFPNLRGTSYKERQKEQEVVKDDLRSPEINAGGTP